LESPSFLAGPAHLYLQGFYLSFLRTLFIFLPTLQQLLLQIRQSYNFAAEQNPRLAIV
jgi:hypothetical protein